MSVTLYTTGLTITDEQAARLDAYAVREWLGAYIVAHGDEYPPGWPDPAGHRALAEWAIVEVVKGTVLHWERREARRAIVSDPWE